MSVTVICTFRKNLLAASLRVFKKRGGGVIGTTLVVLIHKNLDFHVGGGHFFIMKENTQNCLLL